jgi:hypothetical protein
MRVELLLKMLPMRSENGLGAIDAVVFLSLVFCGGLTVPKRRWKAL